MEIALNSNSFCELSENELYKVEGGIALSAALLALGGIAGILGVVATALGQPVVGYTLGAIGIVSGGLAALLVPIL